MQSSLFLQFTALLYPLKDENNEAAVIPPRSNDEHLPDFEAGGVHRCGLHGETPL